MNNQKGNVLFIILIAVILFGALSYAVSSMLRGGANIGKEKAGVYVSEVLTYAQSINEAVHTLRISNECADDEISFERAPFDGSDTDYVNPNSPADLSCHVFHANGGGISYHEMNAEIFDTTYSSDPEYGKWVISGHSKITGIGSNTEPELILALPLLKQAVCEILAERMGYSTPVPADSDGINVTEFIGAYSNAATYDNVDNIRKSCLNVTGGGSPRHYTFFTVLVAH